MNIPVPGAKFQRKDRPVGYPLFKVTGVELTGTSTTVHLVSTEDESLGAIVPLGRLYDLYDPVADMTRAETVTMMDRLAKAAGMTPYTVLRDTLEIVEDNHHDTTQAAILLATATGTKALTPEIIGRVDRDHATVLRNIQGAKP